MLILVLLARPDRLFDADPNDSWQPENAILYEESAPGSLERVQAAVAEIEHYIQLELARQSYDKEGR